MMKSKNSSKIWMIALLGLPLASMAQNPPPAAAKAPVVYEFTIQQAVDYANKNSVDVQNALLAVKIQEQTNREVTGSAYPQLSGSGSIVYNAKLPVSLVPAEFFGGTPGTFEKLAFGVKYGATYGLSASQLLFDGQVFTGLKARSTLIGYADKNVEVTKELIKANVYKVYYQLVVSKTQIDLLDANIDLVEKNSHDTKIMFQNGFSEKLDVDRIEVTLANLQSEKTSVLNNVANGYLGLKVLLGMPVQDSLVLTDTLSDASLKDGVLQADNVSYENRKEFEAAQLGLRLREYDVQRYRLSKIPTLSVNGYYNKNAQRNKFDFFKSGGDWFDISAVTLQLNIPIFNGFATNARISKAKYVAQQSRNSLEGLKNNINNEIGTARNSYISAISTLDNQKKNMALAESVFNQTKKKYEAGTGSQTEINTVQKDLKEAQTNYINSLYNAVIAKIDFLKATGKL